MTITCSLSGSGFFYLAKPERIAAVKAGDSDPTALPSANCLRQRRGCPGQARARGDFGRMQRANAAKTHSWSFPGGVRTSKVVRRAGFGHRLCT
jgi:hypothetical protein